MIPIILDVDTGVDDALALGLALTARELSVMAVTTVAGNVDLEQTTRNSRRVLDWLGAAAVPVAAGASRPLLRPHSDARPSHGPDGLGGASLPTRQSGPILDATAPEVIVRTARRYAGRLRVVCLGPLTNVAMAVRLEPRLPVLIERLVVMGGAFAVSGNVTPVAEFNVWSDPEAASIVIEAGFDAVWVGLDVTTIIRLTRVEWERLARLPHATARLVYEVSRWAFEECRVESYALHDPLAVAVAARPELVAGERARLAVMTSPEEKRGQTLYVPDTNATDVVATKVDAEAFLRLFRNSLGLADGNERVTARSAVDAP